MAEEKTPPDWAADVKRYVPDADDAVIRKIVNYCGIALRSRDASMVSFSDKTETDRVRENYCKKKLGLEDPDEVLDAAIAKVGQRMSDTKFRNRVTVYYLLAEDFGKLSLFGGGSAGAAAGAAAATATIVPLAGAAAAGSAAAEPTVASAPAASDADTSTPAAPAASATPAAPATSAAVAPQAFAGATGGGVHAGAAGGGVGAGAGDLGGLAGAVFAGAATIMLVSAIAGSFIAGRFDTEVPAPVAPAAPPPPAAEPAPPPPPPEGAGVSSEVVEGRPKASVFFAVGKNDIAEGFSAAVAPIKAWLDANPTDRAQLSGFTDPTGNAAANAELAKRRAQAVAAALAAEGVAAERIDLVKPEDSSDEQVDLAGARRVEITVTPG
ncbi:MAG: DUF2853 family protein [Erythrobacter sp.]